MCRRNKSYYSVLQNNGFHFDIRDYKSKKVKCPNKQCHHFNKAFTTKVQAEVDVAIAMTTMELLSAHPEIKNVAFIIGDRDFNDLFRYLKKKAVSTFIFGFRSNLSSHIFKIFPAERIFYINDSWDKYINSFFDEEFPPLTPGPIKKFEPRRINFGKKCSENGKTKPAAEASPSIKKKRKINTKNNGVVQKEEENKRKSLCMKEHISHSSTEDSAIDKQYLVLKKSRNKIISLKGSELDIFIGLNISEDKIYEIYQECGKDFDKTLSRVIDTVNSI